MFAVIVVLIFVAEEHQTAGRFVGMTVGFAGVAVLIGPAALADMGLEVLAQLAILGSSLSYVCASIYGRRFAGLPPIVVAAGQLCASTAIIVPAAVIVDGMPVLPGASAAAAVVALAVFSTALAYVLYFRILATSGATNLMLVAVLVPLSAILLGAGFLGECLAAGDVAGMALIGLGIAAIDGRPWRWMMARWRPDAR